MDITDFIFKKTFLIFDNEAMLMKLNFDLIKKGWLNVWTELKGLAAKI